MGFTRAELDAFRGGTLPDLLGDKVRLLIAGINPGLRTVAVQAHFGGGSNRFYPALYRAGIVDRRINATAGFEPADLAHLQQRGIGITSLVSRASARADELDPAELLEGARLLEAKVRAIQPEAVAVLGITAYRTAFQRPKATAGLQSETIGGVPLWVVPNPSGLNAHSSVDDLATAYREAAIAAGVDVYDQPVL